MTTQEILRRLGGDRFIQALLEDIEAVARGTDERGGKGKVTLTVKTSKHKNSERGDGYVEFETRLVAAPPARPARMTGLYVDDFGLHGDDPRQPKMDLRTVETPVATVRDAGTAAPTVREA